MPTNLKSLKVIVALILILSGAVSCTTNTEKPEPVDEEAMQKPGINPYEKSELTVQIFKIDSAEVNGNRGWGYDIMVDGKIYIHQPNVPAIMGNNGFSSEEKAQRTGEFIISKLKNNVIPPSV
ncbi:MAG TPA: DUF4907 domain-containing protein, partial [Bacteroidia bacterium]|nr:DUF4907 domain-containing protein [Bacteroidia bacterium]